MKSKGILGVFCKKKEEAFYLCGMILQLNFPITLINSFSTNSFDSSKVCGDTVDTVNDS